MEKGRDGKGCKGKAFEKGRDGKGCEVRLLRKVGMEKVVKGRMARQGWIRWEEEKRLRKMEKGRMEKI